MLALLLMTFSLSVSAQEMDSIDSTRMNPQKLKLPENVQTVLIHEMVTITRLMGNLLESIVRGDTQNASRAALEIRDTNLKQEFNSQEIKKIMRILPKGFIKLDRNFHMTANELSKAVDSNDFKTALTLYKDMTQNCLDCHTAYAHNRFENLTE